MPTINQQSTFEIGKDIWLRSRTNAFANERAVASYTIWSNVVSVLEALFLVIPIGLVSYSYTIAGQSLESSKNNLFGLLILLSVVSNSLALFLNIISTKLSLTESLFRFKEKLSMYSLISLKARQLEHNNLSDVDARKLADYLQELFEMTKNRGLEPDNKYFTQGKKLIKCLNTYPFGFTKDTV